MTWALCRGEESEGCRLFVCGPKGSRKSGDSRGRIRWLLFVGAAFRRELWERLQLGWELARSQVMMARR
jgi:hypothetical protein